MNTIVTSGQPNISLPNLVRAKISDNKLTVPVSYSIAPYARFKNVAGVPTSTGGVPMSKLRTLDILIGRLKQIKGRSVEAPDTKQVSDKQLDAMIQEFSKKLHQAFVAAKTNPYIAPGASTGVTLAMDA